MKEKNLKGAVPGGATEPMGGTGWKRKYVKPEIISSSAEELLEQLGTARACSFTGHVICESGGPIPGDEVNEE